MKPAPRPPLRSLLRAVLTALLVPVLLFEEWGWAPLAALAAQLGRLPLWAQLERKVAGLPPWGALLLFFAPVVALFPVKLLALYLFGRGHYTSGLVLLIGAKLAGTAVVARLFQLTLPALMQIPLFARWYPRWKDWKDSVLTAVRQSAPWRAVRALKAAARRWWRVLRRRTD
ncbi:hypothetical protein QTH89_03265 [Variovorax sp. J22G21]|uniref:hypothetical protein n=1 Tax=Variovorax fucosicus TaxID=3053517 RepID=UPI0025762C56|nr:MULTISPECIES: hypothetical protein [unclassified Variovorax]MDM0041159.1 hypothetical protein [Variovorax sp. J22R193]MDM0060216.1 hypothetical protein [Variovorax sp. J22G21]